MRVALTVWEGRVSPVFDVCREALILDIENQLVVASSKQTLLTTDLRSKAQRLVDCCVDTLICGAISNEVLRELESLQIRVITFVSGEANAVVAAFLAGDLPHPSFTMPGCTQQRKSIRANRV